tara:strand:- start:304 stop:909 length:606 start_codon:yes stop_codon:yes gene_type:complete
MDHSFNSSRPHPWHGINAGNNPPLHLNAYIEITPYDLVKYEIDKNTGYLQVDRPNRTSSILPTLYGFVPMTFCGDRVKSLMSGARVGDGDPLDICVISDRPITRSEILLNVRVIGGLPMLDNGEADDKIIAILEKDHVWSDVNEIEDMPRTYIDQLIHYFSTYKDLPGETKTTSIGNAYGAVHASKVINAAMFDYDDKFSV